MKKNKTKTRLKRSEKNYKRLIENLGKKCCFYRYNTKRMFTLVSPAIIEMLGYTPKKFNSRIGRYLTKNPANKEAIRHTTLGLSGIPQPPYELEVYHVDGSTRWLEVTESPVRDRAGKVTGVDGIAHDITRRKQSEQEMRESKALIAAVVENVPLMIFLKEAKHLRFVLLNRAGEELLGHDRGDLLGKNDSDLFPAGQAAFFTAKDREVLETETGVLDIPEEPIMTARKGLRLLHTRKVCIRGADGNTKYLLGISEDITELKQLEAELIRVKALEAVTRIAGPAAHDFNNILAAISGYATLIMGNLKTGNPAKPEIAQILKAVKRAVRITDRLQTYGSGGKESK
jgi:PAS domain S-box-containing protein